MFVSIYLRSSNIIRTTIDAEFIPDFLGKLPEPFLILDIANKRTKTYLFDDWTVEAVTIKENDD